MIQKLNSNFDEELSNKPVFWKANIVSINYYHQNYK